MSDHDTTPEAAELTHIQLGGWDGDSNLTVGLRFADGTVLQLQFAEESRETAELIDLLNQLVNDALRRRGRSGVEITGVAEQPELDL